MNSRTKVYFASDMHFGSQYHADPLLVEKYFVKWLQDIRHDAKAVFLVGDIFDYWFEYKYVVPKGFTRLLGALAELADDGVEVHIFTGNHDVWMFGYFEKEIGAIIHREPTFFEFDGRKMYVAHGDEFIRDNHGFRFIRSVFHSKLCQLLYATIHPRWTVGFAHAWSLHSRKSGKEKELKYSGHVELEQEYLIKHTREYLSQHASDASDAPDFFIFGHRHLLLDYPIESSRVIILGDWITYFSYAVWDGATLELQQLPSPYTPKDK